MDSSRKRRGLLAVASATMLAATLVVAAPASAAPQRTPGRGPIGGDVRALRADLAKVASTVDADLAKLDDLLLRVEKAPEQECKAAAALGEFADGVGGSRTLRTADRQRLAVSGQRLRGRVLAGMPDEEGCEGPITVFVDPERAMPRTRPLPGFERGDLRPVAGMIDSDGAQSEFVVDEVLVSTDDKNLLEDFLQRWRGRVLHSFEPHAKEGGVPHYLVRVDVNLADPERLSDHLARLNEDKRKADALAVSSEEALRLLALTAQEAADGNRMNIGVNWLTDQSSYATRSLMEAGTGPAGFNNDPTTAYNRDPYRWSYLNAGSVQDIGVTEAWTLLDSVDKLDNRVDIAILDAGFRPAVNDDLPTDLHMFSMVPFKGATDQGYSPHPWHGTIVASAAAAVPGNFKGAAGPAGAVGDLALIYTGNDMFLIMAALNAAVADGNNLINMSFSKREHWALSWTLLPLEGLMFLLNTFNDILMFAAAGNEGRNVDGTTCFITCWEKYLHSPCEQSGAICVGGLARNSRSRHPDSNHGHEDVDIFAPFELLVGPDPQHPAPGAYTAAGTSVATPYAVGVAALIWAANPSLSRDSVKSFLMNRRRSSPDSTVHNRVIHALAAVRDALPATIHITTPLDGWNLSAVTPSQFAANVFADGNGTPTVTWRLANNTLLGTGNPIFALPPPGAHTITARATFPNGVTATDTVNVTVTNFTPVVTITNPSAGSPAFGVSDPIPFHAISFDDAGSLPESSLRWFLNGSTVPFATGHNPTVVTGGGVGTHTVRLRGCDNFNVCAEDTVVITLAVDPPNQPPVVDILNPANGAILWVNGSDAGGWYHEITLQATATDPEGGPLTLQWFDNGTLISTALNPTVRLRGGCEVFGHTLTLVATDNAGNSRQDSVAVTVNIIC